MIKFITTTITILTLITSTLSQTKEEVYMMYEINKIRKNPKSYIHVVENYIKKNELMIEVLTKNKNLKVNIVSHSDDYGRLTGVDVINLKIKAAKDLINDLKTVEPMDTLTFDKKMYKTTVKHGKYLESIESLTHFGPNNQKISDRIKFSNTCGENLATENDALINLMVDYGAEDYGHRYNILNKEFKQISIYISTIVVQNFKG